MSGFDDTIRVLHVDDDPEFADLVATYLDREDDRFTVRTARSASDGLDILAEDGIDCIVSDYDMPGLDGIEFLEAVREGHPDLPFVLYTGKGSEEIASDAISAGVTDYLQKQSGTNQYTVLANRIANAVESYRSQQALAERNRELRRFKHMIDSMQEAACIYDEEGRFLVVNEYLADWYDTNREALRGESSGLVPAIRAEEDDDPYRALLDGRRESLCGEIEAEFPGHGHAVLEYRLTPLRVDGSIEGVVGVARDVTERTEREKQLHRNKRAMDEAPIGITITDPARNDNPVIYANQYMQDLSGYDEAEIRGRNCRFLQGEHTEPEPVARMREAIDAEERVSVELRNYRSDGTEFWNRVSIAPVRNEDGAVLNYVGFQQDITDRKQREQELNRIERRYQAVFDDPNILVGLIDTDGTVIDVNQTAMEYVDTTADEIRGESFRETPWFDRPAGVRGQIGEWLDRAASGEYVEFETDLVDPDGDPYTVEGVFRPVTDDDGKVVSLLMSARDITDRKERERELKRYEAYLEESSDIITVLDESGTIKYQSPAVERILGYEHRGLIGLNGFDFIHPDDVDEISATFADLASEPGATVTVESRFRTADDEWLWLEIRGTNRLDHDAINGVVTNSRDITDRKEREQELEQTNALLSTLFETLPVGVLAEDASRDILAVNDRLLELFDIAGTPADVVGRDCEQMAREVSEMFVDASDFVTRINELIRNHEAVSDEQLHLQDGRTFTRSHRPIELPDGDGHLWLYRDITEFKRRERALQRERDRLDEFAGVVSHDLRNPLNVVEGRLELVRQECDSEHLDTIETAVDRIERIIEDVLWLSRRGRDIGATEPVEMRAAVDAAWDLVADTADHAELRFESDEFATATIEADYDRLRQLLENLFGNALEHGGRDVTITVGPLEEGFYVEDDGPGIPEDERADVFTAGYSTEDEGTGFGLTIVAQVVDAHGWDIDVTDGTDGGARFEITGDAFTSE